VITVVYRSKTTNQPTNREVEPKTTDTVQRNGIIAALSHLFVAVAGIPLERGVKFDGRCF
jgi:hypothetical protein